MKIVFITDLHVKATSGVRTGDYLQDILRKLEWVAEYTNSIGGQCVIGGDVFDTATVTDVVKNQLISVLKKFDKTPYSIWGNHDMRYGGEDFNNMTSLGVLFVSEVLKELTYEDFGDFIMTGGRCPVETVGKPQIAVRHALINMPDTWAMQLDEFRTEDPCVVLMGHDHTSYSEPLLIGDNIRIYRPGSFTRTKRVAEDLRIPRVLVIDTDENMRVTSVAIPTARPTDDLFKLDVGMVEVEDATEAVSYDDLIERISGSSTRKLSFDECLQSVCEPDVIELIHRVENEMKK